MSTWPSKNQMNIGTGFEHTNQFIQFLVDEKIDGAYVPEGCPIITFVGTQGTMLRSMIEALEEGIHGGSIQECAVDQFKKSFAIEEEVDDLTQDHIEDFAIELMVQNFKDLLLTMKAQ